MELQSDMFRLLARHVRQDDVPEVLLAVELVDPQLLLALCLWQCLPRLIPELLSQPGLRLLLDQLGQQALRFASCIA
eukprot:5158165-Prymnesium_polylepis.2